MNEIDGTNKDDTIAGTDDADLITGGNGEDQIDGGAGNDAISGGNGEDTIAGGEGDDTISGGNGDDVLEGGSGSDTIAGDNGDDTVSYLASDNFGETNSFDGGRGSDTLILRLTQPQFDELSASTVFSDFAAIAGSNTTLDFSSYGFSFGINLQIVRFEHLQVEIVAPTNVAPEATADSASIDEDAGPGMVTGNVLTNDSDPDNPPQDLSVSNAGVIAGTYGTLTLNADGSYSYALDNTNPAVNALNAGDSLQEVFGYTVTDGELSDTADLTITINGNTDPALFTAGADTIDFNDIVAGTYQEGTQYAGLDGLDRVILPDNLAEALEAGYVPGTTFEAGDGDDQIDGGGLDDVISGGAGRDRLFGGAGNDTILGGAGRDTFNADAGDDFLDGGADGAFLFNNGTGAPVFIDLAAGVSISTTTGTDTLVNIGTVQGTPFDDTLIGDANNNDLRGAFGNDFIDGGAGNDLVNGGAGDDVMEGGAGLDRVLFVQNVGAVTVDMVAGTSTGGAGNDTFSGFEQAVGSNFDDSITGNNEDNYLFGLGGNDMLIGADGNDGFEAGDGDDTVIGGEGNDFFDGGLGDDLLDGGNGFDRALFSSASGGVTVDLAAGTSVGGTGADTLISIEAVDGTVFTDTIIGDGADNVLSGRAGDDFLTGAGGADTFFFTAGWDVDTITDFEDGTDIIDLFRLSFSDVSQLGIVQNGANAEIDLGNGDMIILENFSSALLDNSDFDF